MKVRRDMRIDDEHYARFYTHTSVCLKEDCETYKKAIYITIRPKQEAADVPNKDYNHICDTSRAPLRDYNFMTNIHPHHPFTPPI